MGIFSKPAEVDLTTAVRKELNLRVSYTCAWKDYETALSLLATGVLDIAPLCKGYEYSDAIAAFEEAISKEVLKPILHF
jgi:L-iditol 2-dehydrogenase